MPKFESRIVACTMLARIALKLEGLDTQTFVRRHQNGDWGVVSEAMKAANEQALLSTGPLLSVFPLGMGTVFWVLTSADRGVTTVLLPEEYGATLVTDSRGPEAA